MYLRHRTPGRGMAVPLLVLSLVLAACGGPAATSGGPAATSTSPLASAPASAVTGEPIKIGAAISLTGSFAVPGQLVKEGYEYYVKLINEKGGLNVGGVMRPVELVFYDDQSEANQATQLVQRLISQDGVNLILGPYSSGITLAVSTITEQNRALMFAAAGNSDTIYEQGYKYLFSLRPLASQPIQSSVQAIYDASKASGQEVKTFGISAKEDTFSQLAYKGAKERASQLGLNVVVDATFPEGLLDFSTLINSAKGANLDVYVNLAHFQDNVQFIRQSKELDFSPKAWAFSAGPTETDWLPTLEDLANYGYWPSQWAATLSPFAGPVLGSSQDYVTGFEAAYGHAPSETEAFGSASLEVLGIAIEKAGSTEPDAVRDALRSLEGETITGEYQFDDRGLNVHGVENIITYQTQDVKDVLVFPEVAAQGKALFPMPGWADR